ncbi:hypothetical protein [Micromonospora sp. KLBMP9576]|uniref:hypothetical protein n=1 Tax=Micromonospora sp. KLBMP9576 TaxID=3424769 RepID=UPI003D90A655
MTDEQRPERAEATPGVPRDAAARETRQAQEAHGGSMAPGLVDDTGRQVAADPTEIAGEDSAGG